MSATQRRIRSPLTKSARQAIMADPAAQLRIRQQITHDALVAYLEANRLPDQSA